MKSNLGFRAISGTAQSRRAWKRAATGHLAPNSATPPPRDKAPGDENVGGDPPHAASSVAVTQTLNAQALRFKPFTVLLLPVANDKRRELLQSRLPAF
jgi:hypothetical protein